ncbi:MAG: hydroxymethylbilane synthase [Candidatus Methanomethylophilaceae archaeon]|nr:hydroxymethylbilane synthase [Candidatus Methanomethylophilaceae archaeon]
MIVGTRESKLAMRQTEIFQKKMAESFPDVPIEIVYMKALGDIDLTSPLNAMSGVGAFVRELDDAMLQKKIDASVNSLKDIPTKMAPGLTVAAIFKRDSPEDIILPCPLEDLPKGARVGTSSVRRMRLIQSIRPDIEIVQLRGNIHTRLNKLDNGEYDAILLAKAGLERMGIERPMHTLDKRVFIPAPGQGTIAVECRSDDEETIRKLKTLDHAETRAAVDTEREIMRIMGAGCSAPVGINAEVDGDSIIVRAISFDYTPEPRKVEVTIPLKHDPQVLQDIADYLIGKRDSL